MGEAVAAAVVLDPSVPRPAATQVETALRQQIAGYKVPRRIAVLSELPRFQGKVRKTDLRKAWVAGALELL